mgnify:CR=1 FL=1
MLLVFLMPAAFWHINYLTIVNKKGKKKMTQELDAACGMLTVIGVMYKIMFLNLVIIAMVIIFAVAAVYFCIQMHALHVLELELTEDEMCVYNLLRYEDSKDMLAADSFDTDFIEETDAKITSLIASDVWLQRAHIY